MNVVRKGFIAGKKKSDKFSRENLSSYDERMGFVHEKECGGNQFVLNYNFESYKVKSEENHFRE